MIKTLFLTLALLITSISQANTITVDNINDSGTGSLRQASIDANAGDTIRFNPNLLTAAVDSISLSTYIYFGNKGVVIKGLYTSTDTLFISGANTSSMFLFSGAGKIVLDSLVLINGNSNLHGGAIYVEEALDSLFLLNSILRNNTCSNFGGGIFCSAGSFNSPFVIDNSIISGNSAQNSGGGIALLVNSYYPSSIIITNSTISGNTSASGGGISSASSDGYSSIKITNSVISENMSNGAAGGVYSLSDNDSSNVEIINSTLNNNTSSDSGGGILSTSTSKTSLVIITNSTIRNNSSLSGGGVLSSSNGFGVNATAKIVVNSSSIINNASDDKGGGLYAYSSNSNSEVTINNSTITGNVSNNNSGGGIYSEAGSGFTLGSSSVTIYNSTFNSNTGTSGGGIATSANTSTLTVGGSIFENSSISNNGTNSVSSNGYNIFTDAPTGTVGTDQISITPAQINLGTLANNGGTTQTLLPGIGSIAIDAGDPSDMTDAQNGAVFGGIRDIGAAEAMCSPIDVTTTVAALTITANTTGADYQWLDCNNNNSEIVGATNVDYTASVNGSYSVVITIGICSDTSDCVNITTVGIDEVNANSEISIYPNPAIDKLTIETGDLIINTISILNSTGRIVKDITVNSNTIDVSNLVTGIYFIQIHTDYGLVIKRFVKE